MKLIHLADLHIGKRVNEYNLLEDQKYILKRIIDIADDIKPDGILIAGDIYDRSTPSAEAVELFDSFLTEIANRKIYCFVLSGNHDSAERIAFGASIMNGQGIYMSKVFDGKLTSVILSDDKGEVCIYMMPFIKPAHVRRYYPEDEIENYEDAFRLVIKNSNIDSSKRNVLIAHQFVADPGVEPIRSDSESLSVGGLDSIDVSVFEVFDYVALGHLHGPQRIRRDTVRYAGSPLKYSFSEARQKKSVTVVELRSKNDIRIDAVPLVPLRDMREIKGPIKELLSPHNYMLGNTEDYIHITLTDDEAIMDAIGKVNTVYPNVMRLDFENKKTKYINSCSAADDIELKSHFDLFREFYTMQNNEELDENSSRIISILFEELGGI